MYKLLYFFILLTLLMLLGGAYLYSDLFIHIIESHAIFVQVLLIVIVIYILLFLVPLSKEINWRNIYRRLVSFKIKRASSNRDYISEAAKSSKDVVLVFGSDIDINVYFSHLQQDLVLENNDFIYLYGKSFVYDTENKSLKKFVKKIKKILYVVSENNISSDIFFDLNESLKQVLVKKALFEIIIVNSKYYQSSFSSKEKPEIKESVCYFKELHLDNKTKVGSIETIFYDFLDELKSEYVSCHINLSENVCDYDLIRKLDFYKKYLSDNIRKVFTDFKDNLSLRTITFIPCRNKTDVVNYLSENRYREIYSSFLRQILKKNLFGLLFIIFALLFIFYGNIYLNNHISYLESANNVIENTNLTRSFVDRLNNKNQVSSSFTLKKSQIDSHIKTFLGNRTEISKLSNRFVLMPYFGVNNKVVEKYNDLYNSILRRLMLDVKKRIEKEFNDLLVEENLTPDNVTRTYNLLKLYLILGLGKDVHENNDFICSIVKTLYDTDEQSSLNEIFKSYGMFNLESGVKYFDINENFVKKLRVKVKEQGEILSNIEEYYRDVKIEAQEQYTFLDLSSILEYDIDHLWGDSTNLDGIYTREAYENFLKNKFAEYSKKNKDSYDWVLFGSLRELKESKNELDYKDAEKLLTEMYFHEYELSWMEFLNNIYLKEALNLDESIEQLNSYTSKDNNVFEALYFALYENLVFLSEEEIKVFKSYQLQSKNARGRKTLSKIQNIESYITPKHKLYKKFEGLLEILKSESSNREYSKNRYLQGYVDKLSYLKHNLYLLKNAKNPNYSIRKFMLKSLENDVTNEFSSIDVSSSLLTEQFDEDFYAFGYNLFSQMGNNIRNVLLVPTKSNINSQWRRIIYDQWSREFLKKYPFTDSIDDSSLNLFKNYLNPRRSEIYNFIKQNLSSNFSVDDIASLSSVYDEILSPSFLKFVAKLSNLTKMTYLNSSEQITFDIQVIPSENISYSEFQMNNVDIKYFNQTPSWTTAQWFTPLYSGDTVIKWTSSTEPHKVNEKKYSGPWALVRLLSDAKISNIQENIFLIELPLDRKLTFKFLIKTEIGAGPIEFLKMKNLVIPRNILQ